MNSQTDIQTRTTTKQIQFVHNNTEFIVDVTYTHDNEIPRFWEIKVIKPKGVEKTRVYQWGINGIKLSKIMRQVLEQDDSLVDEACEYNIYNYIVNTVNFNYLNSNEIAKFRRKVKTFNQKIDDKYKGDVEILLKNSQEAKRRFKVGQITQNDYQNVIQKTDDFTQRLSAVKEAFHNRYFQYDKLKEIYRNPDYTNSSDLDIKILIMKQDSAGQIVVAKE